MGYEGYSNALQAAGLQPLPYVFILCSYLCMLYLVFNRFLACDLLILFDPYRMASAYRFQSELSAHTGVKSGGATVNAISPVRILPATSLHASE